MTQFLHLNLPDFNASEQEDAKSSCFQSTCMCCLRENVKFVKLLNCKHASFLTLLDKVKIILPKSVICHQCHGFLKKIELFKHQVQNCLEVLNDQVANVSHSKTNIFNLEISETNITESKFHKNIENDLFEIIHANPSQQHNYGEIITEVKIENTDSDFENDIPLSVVKKGIKKGNVKKKKRAKVVKIAQPKKRLSVTEKYDGKILVVTLSTEEMMEERKRDANKESYLKLPYKCDSCINGFDHELTLKDHMEKRHGDTKNGYRCDICKSVLSTITSFKEHTKRHTLRYECSECGKRNINVHSVVKHYKEQHGSIDTQFTCKECGFTTESHRRYRYHKDKHKQKQQCSLCDSTFVNATGLRVHMFTVHKQSTRVYSCDVCHKVYRGGSGLTAHRVAAHGSAGAYCASCRSHFRSAHGLAHHLRTHSNHVSDEDKRFICDECGTKFLTKSALQAHIDFVHLKTSKHECGVCQKVFISGSALKKHEKFVHKKIRPPRNKICDHCGRGFTTLSILRAHVRSHTGERPLRCGACPAAFAHPAARYTHCKLLHPDYSATQQK